MERFFKSYQAENCCLCGSSESLTGEHKIKASALRKIFGKDAMVIGDFSSEKTLRSAQGPKSRAFHFSARMCSLCNGTHTQGADHEFDRFHVLVSSLLSEGRDPSLVFNLPQYTSGSAGYLNVFRYFAKILCCHIAESSGPRPLEVCEFAIGKASQNIIFLHIDTDPIYEAYRDIFGEDQLASHGGLTVFFDSKIQNPTSFQSSISLGVVRYKFWVRFDEMIGMELYTFHYEFWRKCQSAVLKDSLSNY